MAEIKNCQWMITQTMHQIFADGCMFPYHWFGLFDNHSWLILHNNYMRSCNVDIQF